jgi:hypothetical protein
MFIYFQTFGDAYCLRAIKGARGESVNKRLLTSIEHVSQAFPHALVSARSESLPPLSRCRYVDLEICMAGTGSRVKKRTTRGVVGTGRRRERRPSMNQRRAFAPPGRAQGAGLRSFLQAEGTEPLISVPLVPVAGRGVAE